MVLCPDFYVYVRYVKENDGMQLHAFQDEFWMGTYFERQDRNQLHFSQSMEIQKSIVIVQFSKLPDSISIIQCSVDSICFFHYSQFTSEISHFLFPSITMADLALIYD